MYTIRQGSGDKPCKVQFHFEDLLKLPFEIPFEVLLQDLGRPPISVFDRGTGIAQRAVSQEPPRFVSLEFVLRLVCEWPDTDWHGQGNRREVYIVGPEKGITVLELTNPQAEQLAVLPPVVCLVVKKDKKHKEDIVKETVLAGV